MFLFINFTRVKTNKNLNLLHTSIIHNLQGGETSSCGLPKFFISINLILCFIVSVVSILPKVQEALPNSGLLQSAVVTLYTIYLTWSAVANNPNRECNPGFMSIIDGTKENKVGLMVSLHFCTKCLINADPDLGYIRHVQHRRFGGLDFVYFVQFVAISV